ncbi:MAG: pantoate--beta-alanine ligase, partial [Planctomycetes bacterium]|nr:pantoate--beta-alanine ligase [Planctomycetota bacterium]
ADLKACRELGVDLVFHPNEKTVYPDGFSTFVEVKGLSDVLEGKCRPDHFRGVTTVVMKLLNLVQPDVAYFGRKDYQQQLLIRKMCRDLNVPVEISVCPTVREPDGLALSSRNRYLSSEQRRSALSLSQCLRLAKDRLLAGETDVSAVRAEMQKLLESTPDVRVDYATVAHPETLEELSQPLSSMIALVAARVGESRLIDNLPIRL